MKDNPDNFEKNVFINCPFDTGYRKMLHALIFLILISELEPRIALEREDSGEERINKIKELIRYSKYSIHDISRMEPLGKRDFPRFNLPFELGLDLGCRTYGEDRLETKKCLILDKENYRYMRVISDISGNDIRAHNAKDRDLINEVRNWIRTTTGKPIRGGYETWRNFNVFYNDLITMCEEDGYNKNDIKQMPITEYIYYVKRWLISSDYR
jgi:hypothetical protein